MALELNSVLPCVAVGLPCHKHKYLVGQPIVEPELTVANVEVSDGLERNLKDNVGRSDPNGRGTGEAHNTDCTFTGRRSDCNNCVLGSLGHLGCQAFSGSILNRFSACCSKSERRLYIVKYSTNPDDMLQKIQIINTGMM